ncbi:c-type cytochrome [Schlesneria paludicola]|uniref:c-type cytochrome n=1 Tax=Schlesneria paludicola TaxID=360056 RepID=UPI0012F77E43|nr:c-type cytochrome [Schlesneria paludicola]
MIWTRLLIVLLVVIVGNVLRADEPHRSPIALSVAEDRTICLTANFTAGTVGLVNLVEGRVLSELSVGRGPNAIVWLDATTALVTLLHDDAVAVISRDGETLKLVNTVVIGDEPQGIAISKDRRRAFIALGGDDAVAVVDLARLLARTGSPAMLVEKRLTVGGIPRALVVSPDDRWLVTCCAVPCEVFVHDLASLEQVSSRKIFDGGFNPGKPVVTADSQTVVLPSAVNRAFSVTANMIDIGWVIDNRLSRLPLPDGEPGDQKQLGLDIRGKAVGDANAVALSDDGKQIVVTCGGTHELLVLDFPTIPWPSGDPGDFLPEVLRRDRTRFRRIRLGGRPVDVQFLNHHQVVVANALDNSLQVVDLDTDGIASTVSLGGPAEADLVRRGEAVFYDADRSKHSWFSCHTCHTDGHTSGQVFDTRNDQSYGTPKLIPSLRGVAVTGPWTWHGWQTDLKDAMRRSLHESMNTEQPISDDDVESLAAYLTSLDHPEKSRSTPDTTSLRLGKQLFEGRAGCAKCHTGPTFTSADTFDGAVEDPKDRNKQYNPPSLRGVSTRRRFLHTGKARSLEQVLTKYHRPEDLVGESLNDQDVANLVAYLKSL